jgi:hypothetical protein
MRRTARFAVRALAHVDADLDSIRRFAPQDRPVRRFAPQGWHSSASFVSGTTIAAAIRGSGVRVNARLETR